MLISRDTPLSATLDGKLYVIGGGPMTNHTVEQYDPQTNEWTERAPVPFWPDTYLAASTCGATALETEIYLICGGGGFGGVYTYDPVPDQWTIISTQAPEQFYSGIGAVGDMIYLVGGRDRVLGGSFVENLSVYDTVLDTWSVGAAMPTTGWFPSAGMLEDKLYVTGHRQVQPLGKLEVYDPVADTWETRSDMPTPRFGVASVVQNGTLYVVGGLEIFQLPPTETPGSPVVEAYDDRDCICHVPPGNPEKARTHCGLSSGAVDAHARHGDTLGDCRF